MRTTTTTIVLMLMLSVHALAQKGTGNNQGIAREEANPQIVLIKGTIAEIRDEPCTNTTGRYAEGRHLIVTTQEQNPRTMNIHLGPTTVTSNLIQSLAKGEEVSIEAFKTADLPKNQVIAQNITLKGKTYNLRNSDQSPVWSVNNSKRKGRSFRR